jgi:hypothetical protein
LLHEPDSFSVAGFIGTVDHLTIERSLEAKLHTGEVWGDSEIEHAYYTAWEDTLQRELDVRWGETPEEEIRDLGVRMAQTYQAQVGQYLRPHSIEESFTERIRGVPVPITGRIDLADMMGIVERKTAAQKVSTPRPTWLMQARVYQLVAPLEVRWHITTKQKTPQVHIGSELLPGLIVAPQNPDVTTSFIRQIVQTLDFFYTRYGPDNPWPTLGVYGEWTCNYCSWRPDCVAWQG